MSKKISRNYIYTVSYQLLALFTPLITTPYLSRTLGAEGIGTYSFTTSVVSYFVLLATLGVSQYAQREIAYHQGDKNSCSQIFFEVFLLRLGLVLLSLVTYYVFIMMWQPSAERIIYWVQSLNIVAILFDISWFFQGMEEFGKIVFRNLVIRLLNVALIFLCIKGTEDLLLYVGLMGGMQVFATILLWPYLSQYLQKVSWRNLRPGRNFKVMLELFLPSLAIQVYTVLDKTMLGIMTGDPIENGFYEQAEKVVKLTLTIVTSLGTVMAPRIAFAYAHRQVEELRRYMFLSFRFVWAASLPLMFMLMGMSAIFVPWFFGDGFFPVASLISVVAVIMPLVGISNTIGIQYFAMTHKQGLLTISVTAGAIVNFFLNLPLIYAWASLGATVASVMAELVVTGVQLYFIRNDFSCWMIIKQGKNYIISSVVMFLIIYPLSLTMYSSIFHTMILLSVSIVVYILVLYLQHDTLLKYIFDKIRQEI